MSSEMAFFLFSRSHLYVFCGVLVIDNLLFSVKFFFSRLWTALLNWNDCLFITVKVSTQPISWCRLEANVPRPDCVKLSDACKAPPPPLVVMAMTLRTAPHPKTHQNEIVAVAGLVHNSYSIDRSAPKPPFQSHFCAIAPPTNSIFPFDFRDRVKVLNQTVSQTQAPSIELISSERGLLGYILAKLHKVEISYFN